MTLSGTFTNAAMAMVAQSDGLGVISQNIANVNTNGYKSSVDNFTTVLSEATAGTNIFGVRPELSQNVMQAGIATSTGQWNDLAISGIGFFIANSQADGSGKTTYTQDGAFTTTAAPPSTLTAANQAAANTTYLKDSAGDYLMGWQATNGVVKPGTGTTGLTAVNYSLGSTLAGTATTAATLGGTLPANATAPVVQGVPVYDNNFNLQSLDLSFTKTASDIWSVNASTGTGTVALSSGGVQPVTLQFDGSGNLVSPTTPLTANIAWYDGTTSSISLDLSQVSQLASTTAQLTTQSQNGSGPSTLSQVSFDSQGNLIGQYTPAQVTRSFETGLVGGAASAGDVITVNLTNPSLTAGAVQLSYTVQAGDTPATIAAGLAAAVNADPTLKAANVTASSGGPGFSIATPQSLGPTAYTQNITGAGTETLALSTSALGGDQSVQTVTLYQVPVATFTAPDALTQQSGNTFIQSAGAGTLDVAAASSVGSSFTPGSVEASNVSLEGEFSRMVTTQAAYNAASKVFTVADQMTTTTRDLVI